MVEEQDLEVVLQRVTDENAALEEVAHLLLHDLEILSWKKVDGQDETEDNIQLNDQMQIFGSTYSRKIKLRLEWGLRSVQTCDL